MDLKKSFLKWLAESTDYSAEIELNEKTKTPSGPKNINATVPALQKAGHYDELESKFGKIVPPETGYQDNMFKGLFLHVKGSTSNVEVNGKSEAFELMKKAGGEVKGKNITYKFENGDTCTFHISFSVKIAQVDGSGSNAAIGDITEVQESITAALLEMHVHNVEIPKPTERMEAKYPFSTWIMNSNPEKMDGIFKYVAFPGTPDKVIRELRALLYEKGKGYTAWAKSFDTLWAVPSWKNKLNEIYAKQKPNWSNAKFIHTRRLFGGRELFNTKLINDYLESDRCGQLKDTVDKSDIILAFDVANVEAMLSKVYNEQNVTKHNELLNTYINECKMVGISLKQIKNNVNIAAVNFRISINAYGDNINNKFKVCVNIADDPISKENTFSGKCKITSDTEKPVITHKISLQVNFDKNGENTIHLPVGNTVDFTMMVRSGKKSDSLQVSFVPSKANAKYGDAASQFNGTKIGSLTKRLQDYEAEFGSAPLAVRKIAFDVQKFFTRFPAVMAEIFAKTAGYPIVRIHGEEREDPVPTQAPHIKIY